MVWRSTPWLAAESLPNVQNLSQLLTIPTMCPRQPMGFSTRHIHDTEATMTETPDPGLTDLIAAHTRLGAAMDNKCVCSCSWIGHYVDHPAHVALVVEQHTNRRIAEYIKQLESERETLTSMCSELESIRDEQAARIAELETLQRVDQDLFVQTLAIANQRKERAEKAEATIASVYEIRCGNCNNPLSEGSGNCVSDAGRPHIYDEADLRTTLEGKS